MSATADKARYFLEQSVPELKEFERKKIFTTDEITAIAKKRSDFEHKINSNGSTPNDYAQYAEFEINVDTLKRKRVKRMGIKATMYQGSRRINFILDRGTRKFPGDVGLWMQSIEYSRSQRSNKRLIQIFTNVLRLHPTKPELWIYAAQFAMDENADMTEARGYMQRGLRFCKNSRKLWSEYLRLEMSYIAKIYARRRILGISGTNGASDPGPQEEETDNFMSLASLTAQDVAPEQGGSEEVDQVALRNLESTPIMSGAIPITIFDAAMKQFEYDAVFGHDLFDVVDEFEEIPAAVKVLQHIDDALMANEQDNWHSQACHIAVSIAGTQPDQPEFPGVLRTMLQRMSASLSKNKNVPRLEQWCRELLDRLLSSELDPSLEAILMSKRRALA